VLDFDNMHFTLFLFRIYVLSFVCKGKCFVLRGFQQTKALHEGTMAELLFVTLGGSCRDL
jgi:hypothetical protein